MSNANAQPGVLGVALRVTVRVKCTCAVAKVKYAAQQSGLAVAQQPSPVVEAG